MREGSKRRRAARISIPAKRQRDEGDGEPAFHPLAGPEPACELVKLVAWRGGWPAKKDELLSRKVRPYGRANRCPGGEPEAAERPLGLQAEPRTTESRLPPPVWPLLDRGVGDSDFGRNARFHPARREGGGALEGNDCPGPMELPGGNRGLVLARSRRRVDAQRVLPLVAAGEPQMASKPLPKVHGDRSATGVVRVRVVTPEFLGSDRVSQQGGFRLVAGIAERPEHAQRQPAGVRSLPAHEELALCLVIRKAVAARKPRRKPVSQA